MANGDITKTTEYDKIEVVRQYNIQVREASVVWEEGSGGSKTEIARSFNRKLIAPFESSADEDGNWTHTATDISGEHASVQAICNAAWTDDVKALWKSDCEARTA